MLVLEINEIFQKLIDLQSFGGSKYHRYFTIIARILASVSMLLLTLWIFLNFIWNVNDNIEIALPSLSAAVGFYLATAQHCSLLINRAHFHSLFVDMQAIIDDSTYEFTAVLFNRFKKWLV